MCRALIDSGAGGSYASAKLIKMINKQPREIKTQRIDMLIASKTTRIEMYDTEVSSLDEGYKMNAKLAKVDKPELLSIMSPGINFDRSTMLLGQTSQWDFENLCRLDVLGLTDSVDNDQNLVYDDFKEQLVRNPSGYYEVNLPWKANHSKLPTNEAGSRRRLTALVRKLTREGNYDRYDDVIKEQLDQGIIEPAPNEAKGRVLPST